MKPPYSGNWMPSRTFIHKEAKSMPGFKVCVSTLCDVRTVTKSPNDAFLKVCARPKTTRDCFHIGPVI